MRTENVNFAATVIICSLAVLGVIYLLQLMPAGIVYVETLISPTATLVDNSGLPSFEEVRSVTGNIGNITPVYQTEFGGNITGWKVSFRDNFSGEGVVKTRNELSQLNEDIGKANAWNGSKTLKDQGCQQVTLKPFTDEVIAKVGNSTAIGNIDTNWFQIVSKPTSKVQDWDIATYGDGDVEIVQKISNNITLFKMYAYEVPAHPDAEQGTWISVMTEPGVYLWLKYDTGINGVSKKNVEEMNKFLKQRNVTALSF